MLPSIGLLLLEGFPSDAHDALYWSFCCSKASILMLMMLPVARSKVKSLPSDAHDALYRPFLTGKSLPSDSDDALYWFVVAS